MDKYISKEELIKAVEDDYKRAWNSMPQVVEKYVEGVRDEYADVLKIIFAMTTIDVQHIVHCKDCKYRKERHYEENGEKPYIKYECKFTKYSMSDEGFCSFGVKKDGVEPTHF